MPRSQPCSALLCLPCPAGRSRTPPAGRGATMLCHRFARAAARLRQLRTFPRLCSAVPGPYVSARSPTRPRFTNPRSQLHAPFIAHSHVAHRICGQCARHSPTDPARPPRALPPTLLSTHDCCNPPRPAQQSARSPMCTQRPFFSYAQQQVGCSRAALEPTFCCYAHTCVRRFHS